MPPLENIEIERKFFTPIIINKVPKTLREFSSISEDRYYMCPSGLIRLRDDEEKGIEITAKTYAKDNLNRREINLALPSNDIKDCLEFMEVSGFTLRLHYKQQLKIWITPEVVVSYTQILTPDNKPMYFDVDSMFICYNNSFPYAHFIEIEAKDPESLEEGSYFIEKCRRQLKLKNNEIIPYSLVQLFGAYPR